ncbi:MAG: ATP-binding protein [Desulfobacteraceae bacterium]|nr:ATP-binding protein [Desulfobacteraceae bacterium]
MALLQRSFEIMARDFVRAGEASIEVQRVLKTIGFDSERIRRASICAYESEMNVVMHGGDGELLLTLDPERIILDVKDHGPGIEDVELALQEGYSTASLEDREMGFGAGMGLPNIKKNADFLEIYSDKGTGVHLKIVINVKEG